MKAIWICLLLAAIIALLIIIPHTFITDTSAQMRHLLKQTDNAIENQQWQQAQKYCEEAIKQWDEYSPWYEMIVEHKEVDEIIRCLRQLSRYIKEGEEPEARALIGELDFLVNHLKEADSLKAENIF